MKAAVTATERAAARRLADEIGDPHAAAKLGITRDSLLRVLAGREVRRGTILMLREGLAKLQGEASTTTAA